MEIARYMEQRVFEPIGYRGYDWAQWGGKGNLGPHTLSLSGMSTNARDFARFGYLHLAGGSWALLVFRWRAIAVDQIIEYYNETQGTGVDEYGIGYGRADKPTSMTHAVARKWG